MTAEEITAYIRRQYEDLASEVFPVVNRWLARGDGVAVYENCDLGHPELGSCKLASFGSPAAQLETEEPPQTLPDMGGEVNWRYTLAGTYRGEQIH